MTLTTLLVAGVVLLALLLARGRSGFTDFDVRNATDQDVRSLLAAGRKIDAIKAYRYVHRVDLKAAKEVFERLATELPPGPIG